MAARLHGVGAQRRIAQGAQKASGWGNGTDRWPCRRGLFALSIGAKSAKKRRRSQTTGAASYIPKSEINPRGRRGKRHEGIYAMTWTSDRTGILLYTMLGALLVLSSIYVPA